MSRFFSPVWRPLGLLLLFSLAGCGGDSSGKNRPKTVTADGVLTYKGNPVAGATIVCSPEDGKHAAAAVTDSSGRFRLSAFPPKPGAVPGTYKVSISAVEVAPIPQLPDGVHAEDVKLPPPKYLVPQKYGNIATSGLQALIPPEGRTDLDFDLTD
jgi:hypothetical protein